MIDPLAADHSGGPTNHWIIHLKLQVNQFLFTHWFFFSSWSCYLRKTPACKQPRDHPPWKEVIREIRKCEAPSVVSIPWARLIVLLPISLLGSTSFFSPRHLSPPTCIDHLPPGDQCQACGSCNKNCNYSERSKFLGDNSLFHPLCTWKSQWQPGKAASTHISRISHQLNDFQMKRMFMCTFEHLQRFPV